MMYEAKDKPKWFQFRWKLSNLFVKVAKKIYPQNPEVLAFHMGLMTDQMICGKSIVRMNPMDFDSNNPNTQGGGSE